MSIYGAITCSECVAGKWGNANKTLCNQCNAGLYTSEIGAASIAVCLGCPPGRYSSVLGVSSKEKCIACALGRASEKLGTTSAKDCQACKKGTFTSNEASITCETCKQGTEANKDEAATDCNRCDLGRFGDMEGCHDCAVGMHQDSKGKTNCINCTQGKLYATPQAPCTQCPTGRYGFEAGTCLECEAGQFNDGLAQTKCKQCDVDTYLAAEGKSSKADCLACPTERSTGTTIGNINSTACLCKRKDYYKSTDGTCLKCPVGADCSDHDGITLIELGTEPGYWRVDALSTKFADCARGFSSSTSPKNDSIKRCPGSKNLNKSFDATAQCRNIDEDEAYGGPSCMSCLNERYTMSGGICRYCPIGSSVFNVVGALLGWMILLFLIFTLLFMKAKEEVEQDEHNDKKEKKGCCGGINQKNTPNAVRKTKQQEIEAQRGTNAASRLAGDQALAGRMQPVETGKDDGLNDAAYRSDSQVVIDRVKIIYG